MTMIFPFLLSYILPISFIVSIYFGRWFLILPIVIMFVIHPIIDQIISSKISLNKVSHINNFAFSWLLYSHLIIQLALTLYFLHLGSNSKLPMLALTLITLSFGLLQGATNFTIAHELIHRRSKIDRTIGLTLLSLVTYMHYRVEHVFGHHKNVATHFDPASAQKDENIYHFLIKTITFSFISSWHIENNRVDSAHHKHRIIHYLIIQTIILLSIAFFFGTTSLLMFLTQSLIAISLLETINYIEHYGLERKELTQGRFEAVQPKHSWDSDFKLTNWFLFNLGFHSDHHQNPLKHYENLKVLGESPKMPAGYSTMIILTFFPPLWKRVMNKKIPKD
jgi:alkane 1-monooxygenase